MLDQDCFEFEYSVVDLDSANGAREIVELYGDCVIWIFEMNLGSADGLNKVNYYWL